MSTARGSRALGLLSGAGAAALVVGGLALGAVVSPGTAATASTGATTRQAVDVPVPASGTALVCPGAPVAAVAADGSSSSGGAGRSGARGTATALEGLVLAGSGASATATPLTPRPVDGADAPATASAVRTATGEALGDLLRVRPDTAPGAEGTGTAIEAAPVDGGAPLVAGTATAVSTSGDLRGLSTPACTAPAEQTWLVGGATGVGRSTRLVLGDAGQTPTTVDVTVLTADGPQQPSALQGLSLGPGEQRSVLLEGALEGVTTDLTDEDTPGAGAPLAVQVRSSAGPVSAHLVEGVLRGLVPGGTEVVGASPAPATSLLVPGVVVTGPAPAVLRVANPGAEPVVARFAVVGASGSSVPSGATPATAVPAGGVVDVELPGLPAGGVAVSVEADGPVLAAVRTDSGPGATAQGAGDLAWAPAALPLAGPTLVPLPPAARAGGSGGSGGSAVVPDTRLVLTATEAVAVDVAVVGADGRTGQARRVDLPASTTTAADVDDLVAAAGGSGRPLALLLTPAEGGRAVAALASRVAAPGGGDLVSTTAVTSGGGAPSAVRVTLR